MLIYLEGQDQTRADMGRGGAQRGRGRGSGGMRGNGRNNPTPRFPPVHQNNGIPDSRVPPHDLVANEDTKNLVMYQNYKKFNLFAMDSLEAPFNFSLTL
jgi:hypothetical protein